MALRHCGTPERARVQRVLGEAVQPTVEDLRELSRRTIRAQNAGFLAMLGTLLLFPLVALVGLAWWTLAGAAALGGALFVHYAWRAGEARGEFRKVFKRVKAERRAARTLVPSEGARPQDEVTRRA